MRFDTGFFHGGRWTVVVKRAKADRLVVATAFVVVLLSATLVSAIPIYADAVAQSGLQERLERAPVREANVQATVDVFNGGTGGDEDRRMRALAHDVFGATGVSISRSGESEAFRSGPRPVVFSFFDGLEQHARLLDGRWPTASGSMTEIIVPETVARALPLRVGDVVRATSSLDPRTVAAARVVGVYRPTQPASVYWWASPLSTGGAGPLVTTRRAFFDLAVQDAELRWRLEPKTGDLKIGEASTLRRELARLPRRLNEEQPAGRQFDVETDLPAILAGAARSLHLARAGVLVPSIQLALLAIYGLIVVTGLLLERRLRTTEELRLRGATTSQIVGMAFLEAVLIAVPAVVLAPWLAALSLHALNHVGPLADVGLRLEPHVSGAAYALAAGAGVVCVAGLALPAVRARHAAVAAERRRLPLAGLAHRARLDVVLAVLALLAYWQLRRYHDVLVSHRGGLGIDPFLVAAPAVLLLAGAVFSLRLVPFAAAFVERIVVSTRGAVAALGFWQLARRPRAYARSVLLLVLAVAIGVFAAAYSRTWHLSQVDQAAHAAGADVLVEPGRLGGAAPAIDLAAAYRAAGVRAALPAVRDSFDLSTVGAESGNLLAIDARRAATVVHARRDFASARLGELLRPLAEERGRLAALPLPGRPERFVISTRLSLSPARPIAGKEVTYPDRPALFVYLRDGDGVVHLHRLGEVTAGKLTRHELDLTHRLPGGGVARPRYPLALAGIEVDLDAPILVARRAKLAVNSLEVADRADAPARRVSFWGAPGWRAFVVGFKFPYQSPRVEAVSAKGPSLVATMTTGSSVDVPGFFTRRPVSEYFVRPGRDQLAQAPPVLASDSFLKATDAGVGEIVRLALSGGTHSVRIAGSFHRFPTLDPTTPAIVADLPTYLGLSFAAQGEVLQPSEWWLAAGDDQRVAESLRTPTYGSISIVSRTERERSLLDDPVPLGVIGALALGFVVAAAFAAVGFAASATAAARTRVLEFAVLRSLGLRTSQLSRWISLEIGLVVVLSLVGGTLLGLLVSWLVLPYVALGTGGARPVPPVRVAVPWTTLVVLELALLAALVAIAVAQVELVRRVRLAPTLRGGEGALAP